MTPHASSPPALLSSIPDAAWLTSQRRFLRWGILLSVVLHVALLAWQRTTAPVVAPRPPELEIVLVNVGTENEPNQAQLLAQFNVEGGGQAREGYATTQMSYVGDAPDRVRLDALTKKRQQLEQEQQHLLTQISAQHTIGQARQATYPEQNNAPSGNDDIDQEIVLLNSQIAALKDRIQSDNARPRRYFDAPSTRQAAYAAYIDQWRQRIETIGTEHYPKGVDGKSYGSVQATLTVRADGSLVDISINRPSDKPLLNQAVRRIAQLAAPFAPFPPDMARQVDQLVLTRTWQFVNGALTTNGLDTTPLENRSRETP